jgi:hypothetical protein
MAIAGSLGLRRWQAPENSQLHRRGKESVTKRSILIAVVLAALTLGSFTLVSNLISNTPSPASRTQASPSPQPSAPAAPAPLSPNRAGSAEKQMYADLSQAQALLDQLREALQTSDWGGAQKLLQEFTSKTPQLPAPQLNQPDIPPILQDFFTLYRVELARALNEQNLINARFSLNQLFAIVNDQRARLGPRGLPLEFNRLQYLVREVEFWSQYNNEELLRERINALRATWQELRPVISNRKNGREPAAHFDTLVEQLAAAAPAATGALLQECRKGLELMGSLFQRPARPAATAGAADKPASED